MSHEQSKNAKKEEREKRSGQKKIVIQINRDDDAKRSTVANARQNLCTHRKHTHELKAFCAHN